MYFLMKRLFQLLLLVLASLITTGCATTTPALHVIGVYEGQSPQAVDTPQHVNERLKDIRVNGGQSPKAVAIPPQLIERIKNIKVYAPSKPTEFRGKIVRQAHPPAPAHPEKEIIVKISDTTSPIILALTAYEKTLWKVSIKRGVKIVKVILGGYHSQRVTGLSPKTPIEAYTYDPSPCDNCWQGPEYFYSYKTPPKELGKITGLPVTSFQGRYSGSEFSIFPGIKQFH